MCDNFENLCLTDFCSMRNKYVAKQHENQAVFGTAAQNVSQYTPKSVREKALTNNIDVLIKQGTVDSTVQCSGSHDKTSFFSNVFFSGNWNIIKFDI